MKKCCEESRTGRQDRVPGGQQLGGIGVHAGLAWGTTLGGGVGKYFPGWGWGAAREGKQAIYRLLDCFNSLSLNMQIGLGVPCIQKSGGSCFCRASNRKKPTALLAHSVGEKELPLHSYRPEASLQPGRHSLGFGELLNKYLCWTPYLTA